MYEELLNLGSDYRIDEYRVKPEVAVLELSSTIKELQCPYCGVSSSKVHSSYTREIQDLPIQARKTIFLVKTRKMFCVNDKCTRKTFSEKHSFVDVKGKKTQRLEKNIIYMSTQLSSVNASKILKSTNIDVSKSSICVMLKNAIECV